MYGRGRLNDVLITKLQNFYGLAIRRKAQKTVEEGKEVWAGVCHVKSPNDKSWHAMCPTGESSWCKYQRAIANNEQYDHAAHFHLPEVIMDYIKPTYSLK